MIKIAICRKAQVRDSWVNKSLEEIVGPECGFESFWSINALIKYLDENGLEFKAYFFDNRVPGIDFTKLSMEIRKRDPVAFFVFVDYEVPKTEIVGKILPFYSFHRPFNLAFFQQVYLWALNYQDTSKNEFNFQFKKNSYRFLKEEILYFEKDLRYAYLHTERGGVYKMIMSRQEILEQLNPDLFVETDVSFIVNLIYVRKVDKNFLVLYNGEQIAVARRRRKVLLHKMTLVDQFLHRTDQYLQVFTRE